jgi:hypothetical protein
MRVRSEVAKIVKHAMHSDSSVSVSPRLATIQSRLMEDVSYTVRSIAKGIEEE